MSKIRPISSFEYSYLPPVVKAKPSLEDSYVDANGKVDYQYVDKLWLDNQEKDLRDQLIYNLHEHEGFTYSKISDSFGVSWGRVRQIMKKERIENSEHLLQLSKFYMRYLLRELNKSPD